jgi:RNA polymerase sigma factor (TIGR02999 family)
MDDITQLLRRAGRGENAAINQLMPKIYERLHAIAHRQMGQETPGRTLATTALVHEAYFVLFGNAPMTWRDRAQFYTYAATVMRSILTDRARRRMADKRGGGVGSADLKVDGSDSGSYDNSAEILALDQVLQQLAVDYPRLLQVVELRFFAGLSVEDTAAAMGVDVRTIKRDWQKARALINQALGRAGILNDSLPE